MPKLPATVDDYRALARKRLPRFLFDYIDGGATEEQTLKANEEAWQQVHPRQRVLRNVEETSTQTTLFGENCSMPVVCAPVGLAGMMATRGEVQGIKAANRLQVPFTLSTVGICTLEEVNNAASSPCWFQLYMIRDRKRIEQLLKKAWDSGSRTLVFTVDLPLPGMRHRDTRNGLEATGFAGALVKASQIISRPGWIYRVAIKGQPLTFGNLSDAVPNGKNLDAFKAWVDNQFDPSVTWEDIAWLREHWQGKLVLKGILDAEDAQKAVEVGADGIVVSNHGGRQLDGVHASAEQLPSIVAAVNGQLTVLVDGGIRNGVDVFRALALGADGVMIGRPWIFAVAAKGEAGLVQLLESWQKELRLAMMLAGVTHVKHINQKHLAKTIT